MLTPKTIVMNAAKAPHWTLYRRTANRRNLPRTVPMRTSPSWLMSMAFLGECENRVGSFIRNRRNFAHSPRNAMDINQLGLCLVGTVHGWLRLFAVLRFEGHRGAF